MPKSLSGILKLVAVVLAAPVILFLIVFGLWYLVMSINVEYNGDHPGAYTVAVHSFFGCSGSCSNGEIALPSEIGILETDAYGRSLFYYSEGISDEGSGYGILQKEQDGYAYFYEDDCVIAAIDDWHGNGQITHDDWFTQGEIDAFKTLNDWNQPLNEEKCTKEKIITRKPKSKLKLSDQDFTNALLAYHSGTGNGYVPNLIRGHEEYFITDNYGREMYYYRCPNEAGFFAFVFNPDGTFSGANCAVFYEDVTQFRDALKELKCNSGWNTEFLEN